MTDDREHKRQRLLLKIMRARTEGTLYDTPEQIEEQQQRVEWLIEVYQRLYD
jgi:hypothetical protein